ncbi:MAG: hypothetical protein ABR499_08855 [Gemmatimonadaceae bacterium]
MPISYELTLKCCFCGKPVTDKPRVLTLELDDGGQQRLFAHATCLREHLNESVPLGESGTFGIDVQHHVPRWTLRRVVGIFIVVVLVLAIPAVVLLFVNGQ